MYFELFKTALRYLLLSMFGFLQAKGYIDGSIVDHLVGLGLAIFALTWYWYSKVQPERKLKK